MRDPIMAVFVGMGVCLSRMQVAVGMMLSPNEVHSQQHKACGWQYHPSQPFFEDNEREHGTEKGSEAEERG